MRLFMRRIYIKFKKIIQGVQRREDDIFLSPTSFVGDDFTKR